MIIISDLHLGCVRSAGATPTSALALRSSMLAQFDSLLSKIDEDLIILGDMLDTYNVPMQDLIAAYVSLIKWLNKGHKLTAVIGNHDISTDSSKLSSFQALGKMLEIHTKGVNYQFVDKPTQVDNCYIIPHLINQDLFDMAMKSVPKTDYLLVHCNYNNHFAKESDHSLSLSEEQAITAPVKHIVFAHEHHTRTALKGKVFIPGNQIASSIADCLGGHDKFMTRLSDKPELIKVWDSAENYAELDWRELTDCQAPFVRIVGQASALEAADMANAIASYRKRSEAFVVSNAVKISGSEEVESLSSLEDIKKFNIMEILQDFLTDDEYKIIENLNV